MHRRTTCCPDQLSYTLRLLLSTSGLRKTSTSRTAELARSQLMPWRALRKMGVDTWLSLRRREVPPEFFLPLYTDSAKEAASFRKTKSGRECSRPQRSG